MSEVIVAPSLLAADFANLKDELEDIQHAGARWIHLDVMDGLFVPNLTFGPPLIKSIRKYSNLLFDCHLMIAEPSRYIESFVRAGADLITIHEEAVRDIEKTINQIREYGCKVGISLNPETPLESIFEYLSKVDLVLLMSVHPGFGGQHFIDITYKIKACKEYILKYRLDTLIEIDGGINEKTAPLVVESGADILVAGSAVFGKENRREAIKVLLDSIGNRSNYDYIN